MKVFLKSAFEDGKIEYEGLDVYPNAGALVEGEDGRKYIVPFENIVAMEAPADLEEEEDAPNTDDRDYDD